MVAQRTIFLGKLYRNEPPHGEGNREPDGDRVEGLTEYRVEVDEYGPRVRVSVEFGCDIRINMEGEGYVVDHDKQVGDGEAGKNGVGGGAHLLAREHGDVDGVGGAAEQADEECNVAVHTYVHVLEVLPARHAVRPARLLVRARSARHIHSLFRLNAFVICRAHYLKEIKISKYIRNFTLPVGKERVCLLLIISIFHESRLT